MSEFKESQSSGSVRWKTYYEYFTSGYGLIGCLFVFILFVVSQMLFTFNEYWLAHWSTLENDYLPKNNSIILSNAFYTINQTDFQNLIQIKNLQFENERNFRFLVYTGSIFYLNVHIYSFNLIYHTHFYYFIFKL
jgi:hypothetical protein